MQNIFSSRIQSLDRQNQHSGSTVIEKQSPFRLDSQIHHQVKRVDGKLLAQRVE